VVYEHPADVDLIIKGQCSETEVELYLKTFDHSLICPHQRHQYSIPLSYFR